VFRRSTSFFLVVCVIILSIGTVEGRIVASQYFTVTVISSVTLPAFTETTSQMQTVSVFSDSPIWPAYVAISALMAIVIVFELVKLLSRRRVT